ncbi:MAG: Rieske 2Fe-2S domain-containing protein [Chloroflexi bacterium]|nr:Rieske 2Fe-2S domain-containing protein [Chloroflexota bacterium]
MMLTKEESDLLTLTGHGTLCGELMRRYWQPAALSEELPPGAAPLPVRLLGEELVLFRDDQGAPALLGAHCSHRGADLSYGRVEDGGLRCIYHGWLYDRLGRCLEQPGEPTMRWRQSGGRNSIHSPTSDAHPEAASTSHERIRHPAYPCVERAGVIFAYLGPGEPPLFPNYEIFTMPEDHTSATKLYSECNYLQGNEGNIDLLHTSFLHYIRRDLAALDPAERQRAVERYAAPGLLSGRGPSPGQERCEAQLMPYGLRYAKIRSTGEEQDYVRLATFVLPNLCVIPGGGINWHVPIDDTHHWKYILSFNREAPVPAEARRGRDHLAPPPTYLPIPNRTNRYLQDRELMRSVSFSGIPQIYFAAQDLCATETPGAIQDRTQEHLVATDAAIVAARSVLRKAILDLQEGREPANVVRDPAKNQFPEIVATFGVLPPDTRWQDYCNDLIAAGRGWQTNRAAQ